MISKWDLIDLIERLDPPDAYELIAEVYGAAYNEDYEELKRIENMLLLKKGEAHV